MASPSPYRVEMPPPLRAPVGVVLAVGWSVAAQYWREHQPDALFPQHCAACGLAVPCPMWTVADGFLSEALGDVPEGEHQHDRFGLADNGIGVQLGGRGASTTGVGGGEQPRQKTTAHNELYGSLSDEPTQVLPVVGPVRGKASVPVLVPPMRGERRWRPGPGVDVAPAGGAAAEPAARIFPPIDEPAPTPRARPVEPQGDGQRQGAATGLSGLPAAYDKRRKPS